MGKREGTDLPFVATGRAELKFPGEEDEAERLHGRKRRRGVAVAEGRGGATLAGEIETGERNSSSLVSSLEIWPNDIPIGGSGGKTSKKPRSAVQTLNCGGGLITVC